MTGMNVRPRAAQLIERFNNGIPNTADADYSGGPVNHAQVIRDLAEELGLSQAQLVELREAFEEKFGDHVAEFLDTQPDIAAVMAKFGAAWEAEVARILLKHNVNFNRRQLAEFAASYLKLFTELQS